MKVYLCYQHIYNGCDEFQKVVDVVSTEEKAIEWELAQETDDPDYKWFDYVEVEVK